MFKSSLTLLCTTYSKPYIILVPLSQFFACPICTLLMKPSPLPQPPDDATLSGMVPTVWWPPSPASKEATPLAANYEPKDEDERRRKADYEAAVERLKAKIKVV